MTRADQGNTGDKMFVSLIDFAKDHLQMMSQTDAISKNLLLEGHEVFGELSAACRAYHKGWEHETECHPWPTPHDAKIARAAWLIDEVLPWLTSERASALRGAREVLHQHVQELHAAKAGFVAR